MHDVTHDALVIAIIAGAVGAMIIGALASGLGLPAENQQPDVGRRRRRRLRFGLAGLSFGLAVVLALVLSSAGLASPGGMSLTAMLHKIGEGVERLQARWNAPAPQADSTSVRSVTLDPPVSPGPGSAQKPQVGDSRSVAAVPSAPVASISVPSVALDPPITVEPGSTKKTPPPAGASRSVAKTPAAPEASISGPGVALAPPADLPPETLELSSWESLIASAQRPDRVDVPLSEPFVAEVLAGSAPPTSGASRPTTSSPPTPGRIGSSLAASIRTPPAVPEVAIKPPELNDHEGKGRPERVDKVERVDKIERAEKVERVDKIERVSKVERVEKVERPQKVERVEKIERPQKIERVEKVERVQKVERREKVEKPERRGRN